MGKPESYRANYLKSAKEKLFIPRDSEGRPNAEALRIARALEEEFSKDPRFAALTLYGSAIRGYSSEKSDIDIAVFYESDRLDSAAMDLKNAAVEALQEKSLDPKKVSFDFFRISPSILRFFLQHPSEDLNDLGNIFFSDLFSVATGPKVEQYRSLIKNELLQMSKDARDDLISHLAVMIVARESLRMPTIEERIPETTGKVPEIIAPRALGWVKRLRAILDLKE